MDRTQVIVVLGVNGAMGRLFARSLTNSGWSVVGIDLAETCDPALPVERYLSCDVTSPSEEGVSAVASASHMLACLHDTVFCQTLDTLVPHLRSGALLIDTLSVKTPSSDRIRKARGDIEALSLHPFFAPAVGFEGQNVAAIEIRSGRRSQRFVTQIEAWGARITTMTAEEHDHTVAAIQVATHAAVIAYGSCLHSLGYDIDTGLAASTPPHRALLALMARMTAVDPGVYWSIQSRNPFAAAARDALSQGLADLSRIVEAGDDKAFDALVARQQDLLGRHAAPLSELNAIRYAGGSS